MIPLFNIEDIFKIKGNVKLPFQCECCKETFHINKNEVIKALNKHPKIKIKYCSISCRSKSRIKTIILNCSECGVLFKSLPCKIKESNNHFCSKSCAATYNNKHKTTGNRRSKLETYLETELIKQYPDLEISFNKKDAINSELDIYIPSLKLAFELNGIFHYEPIYGQDKLSQISNNDNRKYQACIENCIELCIVDVSHQKYFKEQTSLIYLDIIKNIINTKLCDYRGSNPNQMNHNHPLYH